MEGRSILAWILFSGGVWCFEFCCARGLLLMSALHLVGLPVDECFCESKQNL
jgi:hypothetical protein